MNLKMRKINSFLVAAVTMFAAVSCAPELKQEEQKVTGETITFTAFADGADTKTTLSGQKSLWAAGDRIWILTGNLEDESWKKAYSTSDAGDKAIFTPEDESTVLEGDKYFAVYPASAGDNAEWDGEDDIRNVYLKSNQTATLNSYDPEAHIAVAKSSTNSLEFKNAVSLLKFKVANDDVKSVTIFAIGNEKLTGSCNVSAEGNVTPWTGEGKANHWVELTAGEGTFETDKEYVAAVFPNTLAQGFTVEFSFGGAKKTVKSLEKPFEFERNTIYDFGTLNYVAPTVVNKIYLKPNVWSSDNAWYSAHFWGAGIQATDVTLEDSDADGIFEVEVPEGATDVIFCRMNPDYDTFGWDVTDDGGTEVEDHVWNQTGDLSIPAMEDDKVCYVVSDWDVYSWMTLADAATPVEPEQPEDPSTYSWGICGDMTSWGENPDIQMTLNDENEWFVAENVDVAAGQAFKLRANGTWAVNRGAGGDAKPVTVTSGVEIEVYHDGQDMTVAAGTYNFYLSKDCTMFKVVGGSDVEDEPVASDYGLVGSFQTPTTWDVANPVAMENVSDGWIVARNVELYKSDEFKFVTGNSWDNPSYGTSAVTTLENNAETSVVTSGSQNMKVSKNGKYNLYLNPNAMKVKVECVEEYTDLMVNITIDNKANWSPLTISLWDGETQIVSNASVTNNKYAVSGDYIGSTLTCQLASGSKTSEKMQVAITKTGATVTLEETIIKLKVQLTTDNAKQWWGNTMKIHVWGTGTSFDTSWPGNTMTSEGNYTWSIIVPTELVGKTIKYLVHNGNGWQSSDATVTIKAEGNTVKGSDIGIN